VFAGAAGVAALSSSEGLLAQTRERAKALHWKVTVREIYTNQGLTGLGEGSVTSKEAKVAMVIEKRKRYPVGKDPADIEMHWQAMYRWPRWRWGRY
jgi:L-alanine-DL-glutamate epimerase-like enolase superfamily enzyme